MQDLKELADNVRQYRAAIKALPEEEQRVLLGIPADAPASRKPTPEQRHGFAIRMALRE